MCGIVGHIGDNVINNLILSLKELEYRGYDSSGIGVITSNKTFLFKEVGKIENLVQATKDISSKEINGIGIGHTRWATHGKVTKENAHPHNGEHALIVHNGIIENYAELKEELALQGTVFSSNTDSEVIVHLFEKLYKQHNNAIKALEEVISKLEGSFAFLLISNKFNKQVFFAKKNSPLIIGKGINNIQISSSCSAFNNYIKNIYYLNDGDYGYIENNKCVLFNNNKEFIPSFTIFQPDKFVTSKENYNSFMEKEILEQHIVLQNTIKNRIIEGKVVFNELPKDIFNNINRIILCACGTSFHAALTASYLLERYAKIIATAYIASEFLYKDSVLKTDDLVILISQSGETADTLSALKFCKSKGIRTLVISNVENSSLVKESPHLLTNIGIEKSVASTKAFSSQVILLWLITLHLAQNNNTIVPSQLNTLINEVNNIIQACKVEPELNYHIKNIVNNLSTNYRFLFLGRDIFYPLALEGALKLKEITYLSSEGYAAGEMKHGPIAIADQNLCTIALNPVNLIYDKTKSNIIEISSRNSTIINISSKNFNTNFKFIKTLTTNSYLVEFFNSLVILQLFALHMATKLNKDIDMPRNLAKSVTVE